MSLDKYFETFELLPFSYNPRSEKLLQHNICWESSLHETWGLTIASQLGIVFSRWSHLRSRGSVMPHCFLVKFVGLMQNTPQNNLGNFQVDNLGLGLILKTYLGMRFKFWWWVYLCTCVNYRADLMLVRFFAVNCMLTEFHYSMGYKWNKCLIFKTTSEWYFY